ncbi:MAG: acyl-CoA dehydrogenase [Planctomycetota bacterium]
MSPDAAVYEELSDELLSLQQTVREFAEREVRPHADRLDRTAEFPSEIVRKAAAIGLLGLCTAEEYGGTNMGNLASSIAVEELSRVCASTGVTVSVHNSLVSVPLGKFGSDVVKRKYLPKLATGELLGAYALSEPNAGSDAANQETRAEKRGDRYLLNGTKLWVTSGDHAGVIIIFARTSREASSRAKGITAFMVEKDFKGFSVGTKEDKLGIRASSTCELILQDCEVPEENVLHQVGDGFRVAMDTLDGGRIGIASQAVGITQACLEASIKYAKERQQFNQPIGNFQAIQWKIADMATQLSAARMLTRRAAWLRDQHRPCATEAAMAKLFASRLANWAADEAVQIHGSAGYSTEYPVERYFRDARITEIYEGTTEIQRLVIARHMMQ